MAGRGFKQEKEIFFSMSECLHAKRRIGLDKGVRLDTVEELSSKVWDKTLQPLMDGDAEHGLLRHAHLM